MNLPIQALGVSRGIGSTEHLKKGTQLVSALNLWNRCRGHGQVENLPPRGAGDTDKLKTCRHVGEGTRTR
jgi:hypothetical protein